MNLKSARTSGARRNVLRGKGFWAATLLAIPFQIGVAKHRVQRMPPDSMPAASLYSRAGRQYLNAPERRRFLASADRMPAKVRLFCLILARSGGRISEALALTANGFDLDSGVARLETLKRRRRGIVR